MLLSALCTSTDITLAGDGERERILAAAIRVAGRDGYRRLTAEAIAREAEVTPRAVERHFGSERECFLVAFDAAMADLLSDAESVGATERGRSPRARAVLRFLLGRLADEPELARACLLELPRAGHDSLVHEDVVLERLGRLLATAEGEGAPSGLSAELIAGGVWQTIRTVLLRGAGDELPGLLDELHAWVLGGRWGAGP